METAMLAAFIFAFNLQSNNTPLQAESTAQKRCNVRWGHYTLFKKFLMLFSLQTQ